MLISEHYDSAALDFLRFAVKTGSDVAYDDFGGTSSAQLYKYLIKVVPKLAPNGHSHAPRNHEAQDPWW